MMCGSVATIITSDGASRAYLRIAEVEPIIDASQVLKGRVKPEDLARAALEAMAYGTADVFDAMRDHSGVPFSRLRVDGGAAVNDWMMQFQADIAQVPVRRPVVAESGTEKTTTFPSAAAGDTRLGLPTVPP